MLTGPARCGIHCRPEPEDCGACKQKASVSAQLRKQLGEGQVAGKDDPRGEIKLTEQEIESITKESAEQDCSAVCPEVRSTRSNLGAQAISLTAHAGLPFCMFAMQPFSNL